MKLNDPNNPASDELNRRNFLKIYGKASAALVGTSILTANGWIRPDNAIGSPTDTHTNITTHEWYGDMVEKLLFPSDWEVSTQKMAGHNAPVLDEYAIRKRIQNPIGSKPLRELAEGKRRVVITFDDLTRPTPAYLVAPLIIDELKAAGVPDESIIFLTSYGSHQLLRQPEAAKKLGNDIVRKYPWINHTVFEHNVDIGVTSLGNRLEINRHFAAADLKICISGNKPHGSAGYGGGGKAVLPGIASIDSICYIHANIAGAGSRTNKTIGVGKIYDNEFRKDLDEAARMAGVDFSVQILYNGNREPVGIFAGDILDSFREGCKEAVHHYRTEVAKDADVVICNSYPQSRQASASLSWASRSLRDGGTAVLIMQSPEGMSSWHGMSERLRYQAIPHWDTLSDYSTAGVEQAGKLIVFSQYLQKRDVNKFTSKNMYPVNSWDDVLKHLKKDHKQGARAAIYPYAPLQHPPLSLDGPT